MYFFASARNFSSAVVISKGTGLFSKCFPCSVPVSSEDELENGHQACTGSSITYMSVKTTNVRCTYILIVKKIIRKINEKYLIQNFNCTVSCVFDLTGEFLLVTVNNLADVDCHQLTNCYRLIPIHQLKFR